MRSVVTIRAALLCVITAGCADQPPAGPKPPTRVARDYQNVPFNEFFVAWTPAYSPRPVQPQMFTVDARQERQFADIATQSVLDFARANPGRLYINGDEPDQSCLAPADYAVHYHDFVEFVREADPTARFSPAGFTEPNYYCCGPYPGEEPCNTIKHGISYADQFYNAYEERYGVAPPVDEWRFHDFGLAFSVGDLNGWWARVQKEVAWSVAHGAKMVLGSWGFHGWSEPASVYQEHLKQAIGLIMSDPRIVAASYWSYERWMGNPHHLVDEEGRLTPEGETYVNPLTDVPVDVTTVGFANGRAKLQWSNTTLAWAAEAEFWVKAPGSDSFVYNNTERVAGPGATQTPLDVFNIGDSVQGRVRYYNRFGQAAWSSFSKAVAATVSEPNKKTGSRKSPRFCSLPAAIQGQPCD
ncbi:MAG TPA: hypothetical protein VIF83_02525 [Gemmatimonadaceae bacterium]